MTADSTHQTAPAATADDLRFAAVDERWFWRTDDTKWQEERFARADRLEALASLLPALLAVAEALSVEDLRHAAKEERHLASLNPLTSFGFMQRSGRADRLDRAADALAALKETQP